MTLLLIFSSISSIPLLIFSSSFSLFLLLSLSFPSISASLLCQLDSVAAALTGLPPLPPPPLPLRLVFLAPPLPLRSISLSLNVSPPSSLKISPPPSSSSFVVPTIAQHLSLSRHSSRLPVCSLSFSLAAPHATPHLICSLSIHLSRFGSSLSLSLSHFCNSFGGLCVFADVVVVDVRIWFEI